MSLFSRLIQTQVFLSNKLDSLLPAQFILDGYRSFRCDFAPRFLKPHLVVWDIGGGKRPLIDLELKRRLGLKVVGLDLSESELARAPEGSYDEVVWRISPPSAVGELQTLWFARLSWSM